MNKILLSCLCLLATTLSAAERFVTFTPTVQTLQLTGTNDTIQYDTNDWKGVQMAVANLRQDLKEVTGSPTAPITVATVGKSPLAKKYAAQSKALKGKTEQYLLFTDQGRLVILGSDKRGTIYGIYELSRQIGVSPWHYWADVPSEKHADVYVQEGCYTDGEPKVRYRGIFVNDEGPCTSTWVKNSFGHYAAGTEYYKRCFDLLLRLKANYMWPAMWMWSFYADDPDCSRLADDMGIIMGTSHHEPMARNHQEWIRHRDDYGAWNYAKNPKILDQFFREGIERMQHTEDIVTIGMRGDGDAEMDGGNNRKLMEQIIRKQRKIIAEVTHKPAEKTPQVWALYKEVQEYYDEGLRVPDDVIYLLCDDNWGNLRRVPNAEERKHPGGWGLYYHVDYVGGPRNAKWLNITPIQGMWEQLTVAYRSGIDKLWVLNVGDIKPMEYPIDLFLHTAWYGPQPTALEHLHDFCQQTFAEASTNGQDVSLQIASMINTYSKYAGRVTPEMLDANTYSIETGEWREVVGDFLSLEAEATRLLEDLRPEYHDSYRELVLFPIQAMSNLYQLYHAVAMNRYYGQQNDPQANAWGDKARAAFRRDSLLCHQFNFEIADGKWEGMMNQKHIGYTIWNDVFLRDELPALVTVCDTVQGGYTFVSERAAVVIEAEHYHSADGQWQVIPDMGRTLSGLKPLSSDATLTYRFKMKSNDLDKVKVHIILKSTLDIHTEGGMYYEIAIDQSEKQRVCFNERLNEKPENKQSVFYPTVARRVIDSVIELPFDGSSAEEHSLTFTPCDPDVVIEKIVVDGGDYHPTYLFGTESYKSRTAPQTDETATAAGAEKPLVTDKEAGDLHFVQLWDGGPQFAVLPCEDYYQIGSEKYLTWDEVQQFAIQNGQCWRLPTAEECHALIMKCRSEWTSVNGVYGRTYAHRGANNDNQIFVPATGLVTEEPEAIGHAGFFWTSSETDTNHAYYFYVYSGEHHLFVDRKSFRYPILLVVKK